MLLNMINRKFLIQGCLNYLKLIRNLKLYIKILKKMLNILFFFFR